MYDERVKEILGFDPEETGERIEVSAAVVDDRSKLKEIDPTVDVPQKYHDLDFLTYLNRRTGKKGTSEGFYCKPYPDRQFHVEVDQQSEVTRVYSSRQFIGFETESIASFFTYGRVNPHFVRRVMNHEDYFQATLQFSLSAIYELISLHGRPNTEDRGVLTINYHSISSVPEQHSNPAVMSYMPQDGRSYDFFRKSAYEQILVWGHLQTQGINGNYDFQLEDGAVVMRRFRDGKLLDTVKFNPHPSREHILQELIHPSILQDPQQPPSRWDYMWATSDLLDLAGIKWERH